VLLVEQSRTAQLLVVGHRGCNAFASTLLGSTGLYCVLHAHSPVLVIRPPRITRRAQAGI
jgi:nucleotide-binding universal stress UspA family protein